MRLHAVRSFYDNRLGLVSLEDDVLGIVTQVREMYGDRVSVNLDPDTGWYHLVEHGEDGTDRLIFSTEDLDGRALDRLLRADSQGRGHEDPYLAVEREQDQLQAELERARMDHVRDAGERLAHALKKEGRADRLPLQVAIPRDADAGS